MTTKTRTITTHQHFIEVDGVEFETTWNAYEYIEPKVEIDADTASITYAVLDEHPMSPREWGSSGTMVVTGNKRDYTIDQPDSDVEMTWAAAEQLAHATLDNEIYYVVKCGCWMRGEHTLEEVAAGDCENPVEALVLGQDDQHFPDGSTYALEFMDNYEFELHSIEGVAAMLSYWSANWRASAAEIAREYLKVSRPDITAFIEWSLQGYSQSSWADGYAYLTRDDLTDPEGALRDEVEEYANYFRGDVYLAARETYYRTSERHTTNGVVTYEHTEWVADEYDVVGGFYGDAAIEAAINESGVF